MRCTAYVLNCVDPRARVFDAVSSKMLQVDNAKVKVKFALEQAMKAQRGVEVHFYSFFNLKTR